MKPLDPQHEMEARLLQLENQGYTLVPNAIPPDYLAYLRRRFDELVADHRDIPNITHHDQTGAIDFNRFWELEPGFADLMHLPSVFPIAERALEGKIALLGGAIANYTPPGAASRGAWHHDGMPYIRLTFFISDITEAEGPTAVLPGSHHQKSQPPAWFSTEDKFHPYVIPGMVPATGKAGTCMINNTVLWHTGTPNTSTEPRRLIWVVYKHTDWDNEPPEHLRNSEPFRALQTDALRRQLCESNKLES